MNEPEPMPEMAVAVRESPQAVSLWGATEPSEVLVRAERVASSLKDVIKRQGLISNIQGKEYPRCEAWTLLGTMIGVFPVLCWSRPVDHGWEARVEARTRDGAIVGAAEAQCLNTERNWKDRDDFALRSMAQTRATAKALRMPLGFVMTLAGYESTPAEEMTHEMAKTPYKASKAATTPSKPKTSPQAKPATPTAIVEATPEQKKRFLTMLEPVKEAALQYAIDKAWILPSQEGLEDIPLRFVPTTQKQFQSIMDGIKELMDGDQAGYDFEPPIEQEGEFAIEPADEAWRALLAPFGKNKGETLGSLDKKDLWWWVMVYKPEAREKNGRVYQPSESDIMFYEELQKWKPELIKRYKFTEPKDK